MERKGVFNRFVSLWRGMFGVRVERAEARNAEAVYFQAITEREKNYEELRSAAARLVYLRHRTEAERTQAMKDGVVVEEALKRAALGNDDGKALALMRKRRELGEAEGRQTHELERLSAQADAAKESLDKLAQALSDLKRERVEMLARKAHAEAQQRAQLAFDAALRGGDGASQALEGVREAIARMEVEVGLEQRRDGEVSMAQLRREAALDGDREALASLKTHLLMAHETVGLGAAQQTARLGEKADAVGGMS